MKAILPLLAITLLLGIAQTSQAQNMPELYIEDSDVNVDPVTVIRGEEITVTGIVKNQGSATTQGVNVGVYISKYPSVDYRATLLKTVIVKDLANYVLGSPAPEESFEINGTVPASFRTGDYYILCYANADTTYQEENMEDNLGMNPIYVTAELSDYQITNMTWDGTEVVPTEEVKIEIEIQNSGLADGPVGEQHILYLYVTSSTGYSSWEDFFDVQDAENESFLVKQIQFSSLTKGSSTTLEANFYMPTYFAEGCYVYAFFNLFADHKDEDMEELSTSNNISYVQLTDFSETGGNMADIGGEISTMTPDYKIVNKYDLERRDVMIGTSAELEYIISNFGNYMLNRRSTDYFVNTIHLSEDKLLDNADITIGDDTVKSEVHYGEKYKRYYKFTPDEQISPGEYYVIIKMDATSTLTEGNLIANNTIYSYFTINILANNSIEGEEGTNSTLTVYPNPATDVINYNYQLTEKADVQVYLYNQQGLLRYQQIYQEQMAGEYTYQISEDLPAGIYYLNLVINGEAVSTKVLVY